MSIFPRRQFGGGASSPVVALEFYDDYCPFYRAYRRSAYKSILKQYIEPGIIEYASLPVPSKQHALALAAAQIGACARDLGVFLTVHEAILSAPIDSDPWSTLESHQRVSIEQCLNGDDHAVAIIRKKAELMRLGLTKSPAVVIGIRTGKGQLTVLSALSGGITTKALMGAIDEALAAVKSQ